MNFSSNLCLRYKKKEKAFIKSGRHIHSSCLHLLRLAKLKVWKKISGKKNQSPTHKEEGKKQYNQTPRKKDGLWKTSWKTGSNEINFEREKFALGAKRQRTFLSFFNGSLWGRNNVGRWNPGKILDKTPSRFFLPHFMPVLIFASSVSHPLERETTKNRSFLLTTSQIFKSLKKNCRTSHSFSCDKPKIAAAKRWIETDGGKWQTGVV